MVFELFSQSGIQIEIDEHGDEYFPGFLHELLQQCATDNEMLAECCTDRHKPLEEWNVKGETYFLVIRMVKYENAPKIWRMQHDEKKQEALRRKDKGKIPMKTILNKKHYAQNMPAMTHFSRGTKYAQNKK